MAPRKSTEKQVDAHEPTMSAMRLRLDLGASQARKLSDWLFIAHHFRNAAVGFITARRRERARWFSRHKALAKDWAPDEFKVNDATAYSSWLTQAQTAPVWTGNEWLSGNSRLIHHSYRPANRAIL